MTTLAAEAADAVLALTQSAAAPASAGAQSLVAGSASSETIRAKLVSKEPQIIKQINRNIAEGKPFYSFEYFPPKVRSMR